MYPGKIYLWLTHTTFDLALGYFSTEQVPRNTQYVEVMLPEGQNRDLWCSFLQTVKSGTGLFWVHEFFRDLFMLGAREIEFNFDTACEILERYRKTPEFIQLMDSPILLQADSSTLEQLFRAFHQAGREYTRQYSCPKR